MDNVKMQDVKSANLENRTFLSAEKSAFNASLSISAMEAARCASLELSGKIPTPDEAAIIYENLCGSLTDVHGFALFCKFLLSFSEKAVDEVFTGSGSVSYVRNTYSDRAFDAFEDIFGTMRVSHSENSKSACESVYYDETDYCILPFESSDEGLLLSFRRLMLKYELRVAAVVSVPSGEDSYTSFALLTGGIDDPCGDCCEMYIPVTGGREIINICSVLDELDLAPERVTTLPSKDKFGCDLHLSFKGESSKLKAAEFCLCALYKTCISLGKYKIYNNERNIYER